MKRIFILLPLVVVLVGCNTYHRPPYAAMGDYGFTYDLGATPSPFIDTSYRPLTRYDLVAPIVIVVTNRPPPKIVYQQMPPIGETHYSGQTPTRGTVVVTPQTIVESAGSQPNQAGAGAAGAGGATTVAPNAAPNPVYYPSAGDVVIYPGTHVAQTNNTNMTATNMTPTNNMPNTNQFPESTIPGTTNPGIDDPAGTQLRTNRPIFAPPGTRLRTNRPFFKPPVPPQSFETNRALTVPQSGAQLNVLTPAERQRMEPTPTLAPPYRQPPVQQPDIRQQVPPASAPRNPPTQQPQQRQLHQQQQQQQPQQQQGQQPQQQQQNAPSSGSSGSQGQSGSPPSSGAGNQ